ncbi:MAG: fructose-6-phosphate aldolase [Syntrophaceae bacterium]|nr:fructose-6-phosphate aldolase [Syntrophaceae bacterium]
MRFFIDTANLEEIRTASTWGIVSGVTTNPSLVAKEGRGLREVIQEITKLIDGPISAEVQEGPAEAMVKESFTYAEMHPNIVIKIPMTLEGIRAVSILAPHGIHTNVTLCFSVSQALMAANAGGTYVSPFMGRLDDQTGNPESGYELLKEIRTVYDHYGIETEIVAASIRHVKHAEQAALASADIATIPYNVFTQMIEHPLTTKGLEIFRNAGK